MFKGIKLNKIIKKSVNDTVQLFVGEVPKIYEHFFYGAVEIGSENLVIWYLFEVRTTYKLKSSFSFYIDNL